MRPLLIGAGAVGLGIASALLKAGEAVHIVARPAVADALRRLGLRRTGVLGNLTIPASQLTVFDSLPDHHRAMYDHVLVCTKAYDAEAIAFELAQRPWLLQEDAIVVGFFNGIGAHDFFVGTFPKERVFAACVTTGFRLSSPWTVEVTVHAADLLVGNPFTGCAQGAESLCEVLTRGDIPARPCADISAALWSKLAYNSAVNALGALHECTIGQLVGNPNTRMQVEHIVRETFEVITAAGARTYWASVDDYLEHLFERLIPATASHETSMLQDLRRRKRTEIGFLNGAIVRLGRKHGVPTPVNASVTAKIKRLEANSGRHSESSQREKEAA